MKLNAASYCSCQSGAEIFIQIDFFQLQIYLERQRDIKDKKLFLLLLSLMHNLKVAVFLLCWNSKKKEKQWHFLFIALFISFFIFSVSVHTSTQLQRNKPLVLSGDRLSPQHSGQPSLLSEKSFQQRRHKRISWLSYILYCYSNFSYTSASFVAELTSPENKCAASMFDKFWFLNICDSCCCQDD